MQEPCKILLVGARGYGVAHLENLGRLAERVEIAGVVDPSGKPKRSDLDGIPHWSRLSDALDEGVSVDVAIIATPTGTHYGLAKAAIDYGCDVYLEKPPVASMAQYESLREARARAGVRVQVGFQSLGSHVLLAIGGPPASVATWGAWSRDHGYWQRSPWAGLRVDAEGPVVDGVVTNALAHAVATALRIAGASRREDVADVTVELMRANDIEADDTSSVRVRTTQGRTVSAALTLCAEDPVEPVVEFVGSYGPARFWYTEDRLSVSGEETTFGRTDLLEDLLDSRLHGEPLLSDLDDAGAYMEVLEAVRLSPPPRKISPSAVRILNGPSGPRTVVDGVADWCRRAASERALLSEVTPPWRTSGAQVE